MISERGEPLLGGRAGNHAHLVAVSDEPHDGVALALVTGDHEGLAHAAVQERGSPREQLTERIGARGALHESRRPGSQGVPAPAGVALHEHRDVARPCVVLELIQDGRASPHRYREQDRVGVELRGQGQPEVAAGGDDAAEAMLACLLQRAARGLLVVVDDERDAVAFQEQRAVVEKHVGLGRLVVAARGFRLDLDHRLVRRLDVGRQQQRERAPLAGGAVHADLAAQQRGRSRG